jgi:uncharacterized protein (DUF2236 family)
MNLVLRALGGDAIASAFRKTVSGDPTGIPQWALQMAEGNDAGFFGPESDVWKVHGSLATLVGGVRALLMQAAYPAALAGVSQHSQYDTDPLGRLERTTRWLTVTSFGSTEVIEREARRVNELHKRVTGSFENKAGQVRAYAAQEERHLLWVHCAFTDSFLTSYRIFDRALDRSASNYVKEWAQSAVPLGLTSAPKSDDELRIAIEEFIAQDLSSLEGTKRVVHFILHPPFSWAAMPFYRVLANAAISTMDPRILEILGIQRRRTYWQALIKPALRVLQALLGEESPSQSIARERIRRLTSSHE